MYTPHKSYTYLVASSLLVTWDVASLAFMNSGRFLLSSTSCYIVWRNDYHVCINTLAYTHAQVISYTTKLCGIIMQFPLFTLSLIFFSMTLSSRVCLAVACFLAFNWASVLSRLLIYTMTYIRTYYYWVLPVLTNSLRFFWWFFSSSLRLSISLSLW